MKRVIPMLSVLMLAQTVTAHTVQTRVITEEQPKKSQPTTPQPKTTQPRSAPVNPNQIQKAPAQAVDKTTPFTNTDVQVKSQADAAQAVVEARRLISQARRTYPAGSASIDQSLWSKAAEYVEAAVQFAPKNPEFLRLRAEIYTEVSFWSQAELSWNAYFAVAPNAGGGMAAKAAAEAQYNLGYAAYTRRQPAQAERFFQNCLKLAPQNVQCMSWAGRTALEAGNYAQAQAMYSRAQQLKPQDKSLAYFASVSKKAATYGPAATRAFSRAYGDLKAGRKPQALAGFQEAANSAPNFVEAWRETGRLALELGNTQLAVTAYTRLSSLPGATAADRYNLGLTQEAQQHGLKAVQDFRKAYNHYKSGNKGAAESGFLQATAASPRYAKAWAWLGRVRYENQNFAAAAVAYSKAVELNPSDKTSAYYLKLARKNQ